MNFRSTTFEAVLITLTGFCVVFASTAWSCGDFSKPRTYFDGIDEFGHVAYWDQIGDLTLADGSTLPLVIGFRSDWEDMAPSPYLGSGWLFALLDAHFVQRGENAFDMISIDGYTVPFGRDPKNPSILNGAQGWKAEISGNCITVWASCGWKLIFTKGKITSMVTPKNRTVQMNRDQFGIVSDVVDGTNVLLKVEKNSDNVVTGIKTGTEHIIFEQTEKPRLEAVDGMILFKSTTSAIGKILLKTGVKTFEYTADELLKPAISIGTANQPSRTIKWDPTSKIVSSDGKWNYKINPPEKQGLNAAIRRIESTGKSEYWFYDQTKGQEIIQELDGTTTTTSWFLSGKLQGRRRAVMTTKNEEVLSSLKYIYDDSGAHIRTLNEKGGMIKYSFGESRDKYLIDVEDSLMPSRSRTISISADKEWRLSTKGSTGETLVYSYDQATGYLSIQ